MKQLKNPAIVLSRVNFRETDRILTVLTPDYGKVRLIAKGVRAIKSKLAGGIELFAVNEIGFIKGRGEVATLIASRLERNFPAIITDIKRVQLGYEILKIIDRTIEDQAENGYFYLLEASLQGLNDLRVSPEIISLWFLAQLLAISGHTPNLITDTAGNKLTTKDIYDFDGEAMSFVVGYSGYYGVNHIKFLRMCFMATQPFTLARVNNSQKLATELLPMVNTMRNFYLAG